MGFFRQKCWNGQSFPSPGDLPYSGIELRSPAQCAASLLAEPPGTPLGWPCPSCPLGTLHLDPCHPLSCGNSSPHAQMADSYVTSCTETSLFSLKSSKSKDVFVCKVKSSDGWQRCEMRCRSLPCGHVTTTSWI